MNRRSFLKSLAAFATGLATTKLPKLELPQHMQADEIAKTDTVSNFPNPTDRIIISVEAWLRPIMAGELMGASYNGIIGQYGDHFPIVIGRALNSAQVGERVNIQLQQ